MANNRFGRLGDRFPLIGKRRRGNTSEYEDERYRDDDYPEDNYPEDDYEEENYDRGNYSDDGYDEDYSDGYNDDYEDYPEDEDYDDRYRDEDADGYQDDYGDDYGDDYPEEERYLSNNPVLRFAEENDWVTYVLLVLLPPLGIWLLWHRAKFTRPVRVGVSAASVAWFAVLLILLFSRSFSGAGDTTISGKITMMTPTATTAPAPTFDATAVDQSGDTGSLIIDFQDPEGTDTNPAATEDLSIALAPDATPAPTAIAGADGSVAASSVYMTATGTYYHNNVACENLNDGTAVSTVTTDVAIARGKSPCPVCYPDQKLFYATEKGKYYHADPNCSDMKDATTITEEAAKAKGQVACPVCITQEVKSLSSSGLKFVDSSYKDRSGIKVYATATGKYFHTQANCSGMSNASVMTLLKAMSEGKKACPTCAKSAGTSVYCTESGKYYHNRSNCSGMEGAHSITLGEALIMGKKRCSTCWGNSTGGYFSSDAQGEATSDKGLTVSGGKVYVYATQKGTYYHTYATCSGMSGATKITLDQAIANGKKACPSCCSGADAKAYHTSKGKYYHSDPNCSGMVGAKETTVAQAMADGYAKCPTCWGGTTDGTGNNTTVYATKNGKYYHTKATCSGMSGASAMTLEEAVKKGKTACPTCATAAKRKVYSTDKGKYYHSKSNCDGMTGAKERTLEQAVMLGQTACPKCIGTAKQSVVTGKGTFSKGKAKSSISKKALRNLSKSSFSKVASHMSSRQISSVISSTLKPGTSGVKVYATKNGKYYHTNKAHAGNGAVHISLETAMKYGKSACPTCAGTAGRTVYATRGGKYYHFYKAHAGSGAYSGKLSYALAMGLEPCPVCVKYTKAKASGMTPGMTTGNYKPGTSGVKVYAAITGKYYHVSKSCAGPSAAHISLETAMNYGKTACPSCTSLAKKNVYARLGSKYYHSSKSHAGSGAVSGTLAAAMAAGMKPCPVCITGSEAYEQSDIKYSAPADTAVYIDMKSDLQYYHRVSHCSDADMNSGTKVMLEFVLNWGFKACPYCNPPTSISN